MDKWLKKLQVNYRKIMTGRVGQDEFNRDLVVLYLVIYLLQMVSWGLPRTLLSAGLWSVFLLYAYRFFSKQLNVRREENRLYLNFKKKILAKLKISEFLDRKHAYFNCPNCNTRLRVPKGVGKITVTCLKCNHEFSKEV